MANRKRIGALWWEPHDPDVPEFFAYETADSIAPVAAIFKHDTHTASRKDCEVSTIPNNRTPGEDRYFHILLRCLFIACV